jgi:hypothetical protein
MNVLFNQLPHAVRVRFSAVTWQRQAPVLAQSEPTSLATFGSVAGVLVGLVAVSYQSANRGMVGEKYAQFTHWQLDVILAAALFLIAFSATYRLALLLWRSPWRQGTYVLPGYLVVAGAGEALQIIPWSQIGRPTIVNVRVRQRGVTSDSRALLQFSAGGAVHSFRYSGVAEAEQALAAIQTAQARFAQAYAQGDRDSLSRLDVFLECTISGRWVDESGAPTGPPFARSRPAWGKLLPWLAGLVMIPAVVALALFRGTAAADSADDHKPAKAGSAAALEKYRPHAGTPAALAFIEAALARNDDRGDKTLCVASSFMSDGEMDALDKELTKLHVADGKLFMGLGLRERFDSYRFDDDTPRMFDAMLARVIGPAAFKVIPGRGSDLITCQAQSPMVNIRVRYRAAPQRYKFKTESMIRGALAIKFTVSTSVPGKPDQPAFELDVPPPDQATVVARAETVTGNGFADVVYFATIELAWAALKARLETHFAR